MKQLIRLNEPISFFKGTAKINFYKNLRGTNGKVNARWNLPIYKNDLKEVLVEISNGECAYCGNKVSIDTSDVEHYLPKENFPYLAYCFENYLCSCKQCNQSLKRAYYPKSLDNIKDKLGEELLVGQIIGVAKYNKKEVLEVTMDRIIEPTFDIISEHLEFEPISCNYIIKNNSNIGKETNRMFFNHYEVITHLQRINAQVMTMVQEGSSEKSVMGLSDILGYSFYIDKFYKFWSEFFND